ncbi:hypothetical protein P0L94_15570 [Microbacter sp. GSS18]|nr:hypothetical protein P0L94_15570 [Microbacter sp. GSS18]
MSATTGAIAVPLRVRLRLGRAAVQVLAAGAGVDLLHIKGDAVDRRLRPEGSTGTDIDVLVRPGHLRSLDEALTGHGWSVYSTFRNGSPFGHAQTYTHADWGYLDVHRSFPGIGLDPAAAFEALWRDRTSADFGGVACATPNTTGQALILILNAARAPQGAAYDMPAAWEGAGDDERAALRSLAGDFDAETAFAAAIGELDRHREKRDYLLWKAVSSDGTRAQEWWGRVRAAPTPRAAVSVLLRAPRVNIEHLAHELGRAPTAAEIVREFFARPARGIRELFRRRTR